ncbi:MAG: hypothetical protein KJP16_08655 [Gammaproteobacteria bacterium]|nr:hypothetical protein [Gammaproteobacteria bacterium]NNC57171.1 hypothetical protein [Woeseiaceae bacterium]NNL50874.1 hypothetical protein [Woeseiaceae bacterium]
MWEKKNNKLNKVFLALLQSLARLFLRNGRGYREFSELSKAAFVTVAAEDYGVHGRPTNVSRIASMTGLTRKEISRIRKRVTNGNAAVTVRGTPITEVVAAWRSCPEFLDESGESRALPLGGNHGSFKALVKQYAGDIPEGALRKELQRIGTAEVRDDTVHLCPESPVKEKLEAEIAMQLQAGPHALLAALARNGSAHMSGDNWPLATVSQKSVRKSDLCRVRKLAAARLRAATSNIAELLDAYAVPPDGKGVDEPVIEVSAGVYYAEGPAVTDE